MKTNLANLMSIAAEEERKFSLLGYEVKEKLIVFLHKN